MLPARDPDAASPAVPDAATAASNVGTVSILTTNLRTSGKGLVVDSALKLNHRYVLQSLLYGIEAQAEVLSYTQAKVSPGALSAMDTVNRMYFLNAANTTSQGEGLAAFAQVAPQAYHTAMLAQGYDVQIALLNVTTTTTALASSMLFAPLSQPPVLLLNTSETVIGLKVVGEAMVPFTPAKQGDLQGALLQMLRPTGVVIAEILAVRVSVNGSAGSRRRLLADPAPAPTVDLTLRLTSTRELFLQLALLDPAYARNISTRLSALGYAVNVAFESPDVAGGPQQAAADASSSPAAGTSPEDGGQEYSGAKPKTVNMAAIVVPLALCSSIALLVGTYMYHRWNVNRKAGMRLNSETRDAHTPMMRTVPDIEQPDMHHDLEERDFDPAFHEPREGHAPRDSLDRTSKPAEWGTDTGRWSANSLRIDTFELPPEERRGAIVTQGSFSFKGPSINVRGPTSDESGPQTPAHFTAGSLAFENALSSEGDAAASRNFLMESNFMQQAVKRVVDRIQSRAHEGAEALAEAISFVAAHLREGATFKQRYVIGSGRERGVNYIHCRALQAEEPCQPVLLKMFANSSDFLSEQSIYDHPYISDCLPGMYDAFTASEVEYEGETCPPCIVLERPLCVLADYLASCAPKISTWGDQVGTLFNLCQLVRNLHIRGVVHNDLTPAAFAWFNSDPEGWRLMAFSRWAQAGVHTRSNYVLSYAAPETVQGDLQDVTGVVAHPAADMWALGVIAFEMFTGHQLFGDASDAHIVAVLLGFEELPLEADPQLLQSLGLSADAEALIRGLLRRDANQRMTMDQVFQSPIFDALCSPHLEDSTSPSKSRLAWSRDFRSKLASGLYSAMDDLDAYTDSSDDL
ncbi:hypothetical protein WJX72_011167 [[Myrmecia] bisecta]|uniref:Protein kinase domain-containing protein n=1 Tax=[Myrmecia] bisecta TaxID=41462 RepID=A0AAW1Q6G2_9CHLO